MRNVIYINKDELDQISLYKGNKETQLFRYFEPQPGLFVAETLNVIEIAVRKNYQPFSVVCTEKMLKEEILQKIDADVYVVNRKEAEEYFGYVFAGEISAVFYRKDNKEYENILTNARRVVVLENIENPTNLGAIFRSAAALNIDGVLLTKDCTDPFYRRAIRTSTGNTLLVPWAYLGDNWLEDLTRMKFKTVAMALREDNTTIDDPELKKIEKMAIIMGNEGDGLKEETIRNCDYVAKIPMHNGVDSLNVAVAASLAMWELSKK